MRGSDPVVDVERTRRWAPKCYLRHTEERSVSPSTATPQGSSPKKCLFSSSHLDDQLICVAPAQPRKLDLEGCMEKAIHYGLCSSRLQGGSYCASCWSLTMRRHALNCATRPTKYSLLRLTPTEPFVFPEYQMSPANIKGVYSLNRLLRSYKEA